MTRLLLVDDHPVLRAGINLLLSAEEDLEVVGEVDDGLQAVQFAGDNAVDVIIMDVALPHLTGADATKTILQGNPRQRVLVFSSHEQPSLARQLLAMGAAGYVLKRSASEELVRAVRVVASGGTYLDPALAQVLVHDDGRRLRPTGTPSLSDREAEVIRLIARGQSAKEAAKQLGLSARTLETYKGRAMAKLELRSRAELISYAMRNGWLRDP